MTVAKELEGAELGDTRLAKRLVAVAESLEARPADSFPKAMSEAELEGAYRFFGNEQVTPAAILAPHVRATSRRAKDREAVLVVHDTTEFKFSGSAVREGLGRLMNPGQGFFAHFSLALAGDGSREPLGLLGLDTIFRLDEPTNSRKSGNRKPRGESARWLRGIDASEGALGGEVRAIHIMDREADSFSILSALHQAERSYVIRAYQDRVLVGEAEQRLRDMARGAPGRFEREVPLSRRPHRAGNQGKAHPAREARTATLKFGATSVDIQRTTRAKGGSKFIRLNVVCVVEDRPPPDEEPIEWFLLTDLPVTTDAQIEFIVDCYRARWTIEDYFKALKTGCQYEKRQLESAHSLLNALAIFAPVAWRLLLLRHLARAEPDRPASDALTLEQLEVLRAVARKPLPKKATIKDAMLAVAGLGGHLPRNGDPGWLVLGRGMHDLLLLELGWRARQRSDQ